jgi:subtilase family serine protease
MRKHHTTLFFEELESRDLLSAGIPLTDLSAFSVMSALALQPAARSNSTVVGYQPNQIRTAYGFYQVPFLESGGQPNSTTYNNTAGQGQTIAIIDVDDDPYILSDANTFSRQFGLPQFDQGMSNSPTFVKVNELGQSGGPFPATNSTWAGEISLDVEWAHALAPQANIVLIEANSESTSDIFQAMSVAQNYGPVTDGSGRQDPVTVVSMSWGYNEADSFMQANMAGYDSTYLTTPAGHAPLTFVAATLDNGARYGVYWPAVSPNVLAVGGTTLTVSANSTWAGETGWQYSGGGISKYEPQPSYQQGVVSQSTTMRTNPDVAFNASPSPGFAVYDSVPYAFHSGWLSAYGTSAGTAQWAALVALTDQGLALQGQPSLGGRSQLLPALYHLAQSGSYSSYFHDITQGNNGYPAGPGYDLVTGLGTPIVNNLIPAVIDYVLQPPPAALPVSPAAATQPALAPSAVLTPAAEAFAQRTGEPTTLLPPAATRLSSSGGLVDFRPTTGGAGQGGSDGLASPLDRFWLAALGLLGNDSAG